MIISLLEEYIGLGGFLHTSMQQHILVILVLKEKLTYALNYDLTIMGIGRCII